jgi:hypothetical protein
VAADLSAVDFIHPRDGKIVDAETVRKAHAPRQLDEVEQQIRTYVRSGR